MIVLDLSCFSYQVTKIRWFKGQKELTVFFCIKGQQRILLLFFLIFLLFLFQNVIILLLFYFIIFRTLPRIVLLASNFRRIKYTIQQMWNHKLTIARRYRLQGCIHYIFYALYVDDLLYCYFNMRRFFLINFLIQESQISNIKPIFMHDLDYALCISDEFFHVTLKCINHHSDNMIFGKPGHRL